MAVSLSLVVAVGVVDFADHGAISFSQNRPAQIYAVGGHNYELNKFHTDALEYEKHPGSKGSSYLEIFANALILVSATGTIAYVNLEALKQDKFEMTKIPSNIRTIVRYKEFFQTSRMGIKDVLILGKRIYLSFTNELKPACFNTSILVAEMNLKALTFRKFFEPENCMIKREFEHFNAHHSGGRMVPYKDSELLFSSGEYKYRNHAQSLDNPFGKVIAIDLETAEYEIVAMGLRDPQGLHYLMEEHTIYITDHGPQGGDEINIVDNPGDDVANFGWPISSYGEHYGFAERDNESIAYKKAPLYKSHKDHGFIEPAVYFDPSIAISEIEWIPKKFNGANSKQFLVGAMGNKPAEGDMALHLVQFDKDNKFSHREVIPLNERVRDILYSHEIDGVIMFLETSPAIGVLESRD